MFEKLRFVFVASLQAVFLLGSLVCIIAFAVFLNKAVELVLGL